MAKPNYRQQKKSKEAARKVRQAEKLQRRKPRPEDEPTAAGARAGFGGCGERTDQAGLIARAPAWA